MREAIHGFKYGGRRILADPLAQTLHNYLTTAADFPWRRADCIVPVPIHPARQRIRGYNQSELLAERLCELTGLPLLRDAVVRRRHTRPQVELSGDERRTNVRGAFRAAKPSELRGKIVLLVDDVATTSSTIHECSLALLSAGAFKVYVVCLAFGA
ncbi:MAG TPA: ComF family protein [Armatimonadota bacterium]|nr:ComF family protein [Armatimonadota bacterium]